MNAMISDGSLKHPESRKPFVTNIIVALIAGGCSLGGVYVGNKVNDEGHYELWTPTLSNPNINSIYIYKIDHTSGKTWMLDSKKGTWSMIVDPEMLLPDSATNVVTTIEGGASANQSPSPNKSFFSKIKSVFVKPKPTYSPQPVPEPLLLVSTSKADSLKKVDTLLHR